MRQIAGHASTLAAMGSIPRLRIMRLLLSAHPDGLVVGEIQAALKIASSTLSHHLDRLRRVKLVDVKREGTCLRCRANTAALNQVLAFLYAECCRRGSSRTDSPIITLGSER